MKQVVRVFYNDSFNDDILLLQLSNDKTNSVLEKDHVTVLYDANENIIGYNISVNKSELPSKTGYLPLTSDLQALINKQLKAAKLEELEFDLTERLVVGEIKEFVKAPNSQHLSICQVDVGEDKLLQIVCGASNVKEGLRSIVALDQAILPDGTLITSGKVNGIESFGMLCSAKELGLLASDYNSGIIELNEDVGVRLSEIDWRKYHA